jgi:hypothetical protein
VRVLRGVRQRFRGHVIGRHLDGLVEPLAVERESQVNRNGGSARERAQRGGEAALGQHRRVKAAGQLPQIAPGASL